MRTTVGVWPIALAVVGLIFAATGTVYAQYHVNGTITGTITDPSAAVVAGVQVSATNTATNASQSTTTNSAGVYLFSDIAPATYTLTATKEGFRTCRGTGVVLEPSATRTFSCALQVGQATETVSVSAGALEVQTDTSQLNGVINSTQIEQLPDNGRNFANFMALEPGVAGIGFDSFNSMNIFATQGVAVNGLRDSDNNILIEGVSSQRTRDNAATTAAPALDAIGEMNVVSTGYMPEYSRGAGAQIVVQLKSGTDVYHGSLYEYNQNTAYDSAANYAVGTQGNKPGTINWNNFGGTFGGPVPGTNKKLLFFFSEDVTRQPGASPNNVIVPSALAHQGDFSEYCAAKIACPTVPAYLNGQTDPNTNQTLMAGQRFPNNQIAKAFWSTNSAAFMGVFPMPNIATGTVANGQANYFYLSQNPNNNHTESLKVDYIIDQWKSHLAVTLRHYRTDSFSGNFGGSPQLLNWNIQEPERGATIDLATTFSPTLVNDLLIGSTEDIVHVRLGAGPRGNGLDRSTVGITFPYIFGDASKDVPGKTPTIRFGGPNNNLDQGNSSFGFNLNTDAYPSQSIGKIFQYSDTLTKTKGNHILKFGVWVEQDGENDDDQLVIGGQNLNGTFTFAATNDPHTTGLPLADMLLGAADNYAEYGYRNLTPWVAWQQGYFGQDTWKVNRHLTIEGGLRWDYFPNYHARWCNFSMFDPLNYSTTAGQQQTIDPATGLINGGNYYNGVAAPCSRVPSSGYGHFGILGEGFNSGSAATLNQELMSAGMLGHFSNTIIPNHHNAWQPRLGFSWDPLGDAKTVIRGSAGIFFNHETLSDQTQMGRNVPFQTNAAPNNINVDCPGTPQSSNSSVFGCTGAGSVFTPGVLVVPSPTNEQIPIPISGQDIKSPLPIVYSFHFGVQHMFPQNTLVEVGYVGTETHHFSVLENLNELPPGTFGDCTLGGGSVSPTNRALCAAGSPYIYNNGAHGGTATQISTIVPYLGFSNSSFTYQINNANSAYNALQASLRRTMTKNLMLTAVYTYANAHDIGSELQSSIVDHYNPVYNRGNPDWLQHHNFTASYVYRLPFFENNNKLQGRLLGGWEVSGTFIVRSGSTGGPNGQFTVTDAGSDLAGLGVDNGEHAQLVSGCNPNSGPRSKTEFFNTSCFTLPAPGTLGNAPRNLIIGPRFWIWDAGLHKNGQIYEEKFTYQFRAEAFNVLNHPIPNQLDSGITDGTFGAVTSVYNNNGDQRIMQLGLRLIF